MSLETFIPPVSPSVGLSNKPEIRVNKSSFGDGYQQSTRDGLNHIRDVVMLRWDVLTREQHAAIEAFLRARGGDQSFWYRIDGRPERQKFTCEEWSSAHITGGFMSVDATFRQSFSLAT